MKVLVLVQSLEKGGRTVRVADTARELVALGHDVRIITFSPIDSNVKGCFLHDLDVEVCPKSEGFDLALFRYMRRAIKQGGFNVIHSHCETSYLYGGLVGRLYGVPVIGTYHRSNLDFFRDRLKYKLLNRLLNHCVAISVDRKRLIVDQLKRREDHVSVIHGGVDIETLLSAKKRHVENGASLGISSNARPMMLSIGHVGNIKGHDIVIRAMAKVLEHYPSSMLYICGTGDQEETEALLALIDALNLSEHVHLQGQVYNPAEWMSVADVFVVAPREEGFGLVFAEASAMGLPIVASRVGGIPEIIDDGQTGLLVNVDSVEDVASALLRVIGDKPLAARLGEAASKRAKELFSLELMGKKYALLMKSILKKGRSEGFQGNKTSPLRVAHFVSSLNIGGAERFSIDLSMEKQRGGLKPIIINLGHFTDLFVGVAQEAGVPTYSPKTNNRWLTFIRIMKILSDNNIDICQIHSPAIVKYLLPVMPFMRQKIIYTRHGERSLASFQWRLTHLLLKPFVDKVTFVSSGGLDVFIRQQGWPLEKCQVVENGVYIPPVETEEAILNASSVVRIGSVGRMVGLKKQIHLLDAFFQMSNSLQERVALHFFGDGPELAPLKEIVASSNFGGEIVFHGAVLEREDIYKDFDVLVVNSETEGLSLAIMEALARGKAVIASDVGGNAQLVDHQVSGFVYPYGDIGTLQSYMEYFLENPEEIKKMGAKGRDKMRREYSMEETSRRYLGIYNE
ncbi:MAG: glycosyltransferase family 4 protein [Pseudomonadales bacterium]|nr:glycosyltransferase family 4 protein [Pseudomonadales bacterium]